MNRTIAFAYAITGLAVAAALVAIVGTTAGLFGAATEPTQTTLVAPPVPASPEVPAAASAPTALAPAPDPGTEIVYVDAPPSRRDDDDDRGDHGDDHDEEERDDD